MSIKFHLPDFCGNYKMNLYLADTLNEHPEYFYDDIKIASSYGCFPPAAWNGGRTVTGAVRREFIDFIIKEYNSRGIPIRYTFTNPLIKEEHLGNPFCNLMLRLGDNGLNEVIVNSPLLEDYIRKNYPSYKITSSTCKQIRGEEALIAELEKDYNLVVLDYNWNNDFEFLERLPHKEKCELLVNACCMPDCKRRGEHYNTIGEEQIRFDEYLRNPMLRTKPFIPKEFDCPSTRLDFYQTIGFRTHISADDLYGKYVPMGYNQFKLEGRTVPDINVLEAMIYYMVKPEYKDEARLMMLLKLTAKVKYFK